MKITDINYKKITIEDYNQWKALWNKYLLFYNTTRNKNIYDSAFKRITDLDYPSCNGYIAYIDQKAIAIVHYIFHDHLWQENKICYLQDLFVDEKYRNMGIARKLIDKVYKATDLSGATGVYWMTQQSNYNAQQLYNKIAIQTDFIKYKRI